MPESHSNEPLRHAVDLLVSLVGIAVFAPLMLAAALLGKLDSWAPATQEQPRSGLDRCLSRGSDLEGRHRRHERGFRIS